MKNPTIFLAFLLLSSIDSFAQTPYKSPSFANDIIIQDKPERDQRNVAFCTAFTGRHYSAYSYYSEAGSITELTSDDEGLTWTPFWDPGIIFAQHETATNLQLIANGTTVDNLVLFRLMMRYDSLTTGRQLSLVEYNGVTLQFTGGLMLYINGHEHYGVMASDNLFPAQGTNPFSLAIAYTASNGSFDSLRIEFSSDGGKTLSSHQVLYGTHTKYLGRVDLSYGRSASYPEGSYFAVWEEKDSAGSPTGHIYTSHNLTGFNSDFSTPIRLDDFLPGSDGLLRNPKISCQVSAVDNDSANLTEVILAEKYDPVSQKFQVVGFYNPKGSSASTFQTFVIGDPLHNNKQPDICFNPYNSTFIVTYFDSTAKELPYLTHDFNFSDPVAWTVVNSAYNDQNNISNPHPKINICYDSHSGAVVWSADNPDGNGVASYDAPFHYYAGVQRHDANSGRGTLQVHPNPCKENFTLQFDTDKSSPVKISIYAALGDLRSVRKVNVYSLGHHSIDVDATGLLPGCYVVQVESGDFSVIEKFLVIR